MNTYACSGSISCSSTNPDPTAEANKAELRTLLLSRGKNIFEEITGEPPAMGEKSEEIDPNRVCAEGPMTGLITGLGAAEIAKN